MWRMMLAPLVPATLLLLAAAVRAETPIGMWETGESHVEIYNCGDLLCDRIVALDEPPDAEGKPKIDENNPDAALRTRPLLGMDLIAGFSRTSCSMSRIGNWRRPCPCSKRTWRPAG